MVAKMKMYMKTAQSKSCFVFWKGNGLIGVAVAMAICAWAVICITTSMFGSRITSLRARTIIGVG